jgi:hypothetical protein
VRPQVALPGSRRRGFSSGASAECPLSKASCGFELEERLEDEQRGGNGGDVERDYGVIRPASVLVRLVPHIPIAHSRTPARRSSRQRSHARVAAEHVRAELAGPEDPAGARVSVRRRRPSGTCTHRCRSSMATGSITRRPRTARVFNGQQEAPGRASCAGHSSHHQAPKHPGARVLDDNDDHSHVVAGFSSFPSLTHLSPSRSTTCWLQLHDKIHASPRHF